jgi:hypothetical protein
VLQSARYLQAISLYITTVYLVTFIDPALYIGGEVHVVILISSSAHIRNICGHISSPGRTESYDISSPGSVWNTMLFPTLRVCGILWYVQPWERVEYCGTPRHSECVKYCDTFSPGVYGILLNIKPWGVCRIMRIIQP